MAATIQIIGMNKVLANLNKKQAKAIRDSGAEARVGFTAEYAVHVHEIDKNYRNGKKWKYLETSTRNLLNSGELSRIITGAYKGGATLQQSLRLAALRIQRESQLAVPLDTGNLKGSAFTRVGKA